MGQVDSNSKSSEYYRGTRGILTILVAHVCRDTFLWFHIWYLHGKEKEEEEDDYVSLYDDMKLINI